MLDDAKKMAKMKVLQEVSELMDKIMSDKVGGAKAGQVEIQIDKPSEPKLMSDADESKMDLAEGEKPGMPESSPDPDADPALLDKLKELYSKIG